MRIVLLNQFYPPDAAPTGRYLHDVARVLVARGHQVRMVASRRAYAGGGDYAARETIDGVEVVRLGGFGFGRGTHVGKIVDHGAYVAGMAAHLARDARFDVIVALTSPPLLGLFARAASLRGQARVVHWVMDLYPDALAAHGMPHGRAYDALATVARQAFTGSAAVVALGPAMAERLRAYVPEAVRLEWVPLWTPPELVPWPDGESVPMRRARGWDDGRATLLYSGNLGLGHRFEEFLAGAERLGASGPRWVFAGQGRALPALERFASQHPALPIELRDAVEVDALREHLCSADVHLASLDACWSGIILPSKLQAAFGVARPVIFVGPPDDDVARWVVSSGGGWVAREGDVDGLLACVRQASDAGEVARRGKRGHAYACEQFAMQRNAARIADVIEDAGRVRR